MTVRSYDSFEEMQADMMRAEAAANAKVTPAQKAIKPGDYVLQVINPQIGDLVVIGKTLTVDEYVAREKALWREDEDGPFDEKATRAHEEEMITRGYIYGWWSSAWETGEWGSVHRYNMLTSIPEVIYLGALETMGANPIPPVGRAF